VGVVTRERAAEVLLFFRNEKNMSEELIDELLVERLAHVIPLVVPGLHQFLSEEVIGHVLFTLEDRGDQRYYVNVTALQALAEGASLAQARAARDGGPRPWAS
jgi:hypothetical protein